MQTIPCLLYTSKLFNATARKVSGIKNLHDFNCGLKAYRKEVVKNSEAAIGMINNKTTAVRIIPAPGKGVGGQVNFGGLLGRAPILPVHNTDSSRFVLRGGNIPAPIHSFKN